MFIRSAFNRGPRTGGLSCADKSRAIQSQKDDADINVIMKRFGRTGLVPQNIRVPLNGDFQEAGDFRSSMDAIVAAKHSFMAMPAEVRSRFGNDPASFVEFCSDKENLGEMRKLGLAIPEIPAIIPPVVKVEVVNPLEGVKDGKVKS